MDIPGLNEALIRQRSTAQSFERGRDYYASGSVLALVRRGDVLHAEVQGSQWEPYAVSISLDEEGLVDETCDCPYSGLGWCKHIVATLLIYLHAPESANVRPPLEELLAGLDREQLVELLLRLATEEVGLVDAIEREVATLPSAAEPGSPGRRVSVDPEPIHREVRAILHSLDHMRRSDAYWLVGRAVDEVRQVLSRAQGMILATDVMNALVTLEAITDEYVEGWAILDDSDGHAGAFFAELGDAWEQAVIAANLPPAERGDWRRKLARWETELEGYEIGHAFALARMALEA